MRKTLYYNANLYQICVCRNSQDFIKQTPFYQEYYVYVEILNILLIRHFFPFIFKMCKPLFSLIRFSVYIIVLPDSVYQCISLLCLILC